MAKKPEKSVMLGTRISPKAQYGLRLLARVQGRTIAEAVEWAINLALRQTRIGGGVEAGRLNTLVDAIWTKDSEPERIRLLNDTAPELLDFDERSAWNLVRRCPDLSKPIYWALTTVEDDNGESMPMWERVEKDDPRRDEEHDGEEFDFDLINQHWDAIKSVGAELGTAGEIEKRFTLAEILDGTALAEVGSSIVLPGPARPARGA